MLVTYSSIIARKYDAGKRNTPILICLHWHELWLFLLSNILASHTVRVTWMNLLKSALSVRPPNIKLHTYNYSTTFNLLGLLQKYFYLYVQHVNLVQTEIDSMKTKGPSVSLRFLFTTLFGFFRWAKDGSPIERMAHYRWSFAMFLHLANARQDGVNIYQCCGLKLASFSAVRCAGIV